MRQARSRAITRHSLIEGATGCDAEFYGKWLSMAGRAETLWKRALTMPIFSKRVERLTIAYIPDFGISATALLSQIYRDRALVALDMWGEGGEEFAMMVDMGFFTLRCGRYRMNLPKRLNVEVVKSAALKLTRTEDREHLLHPESFIASMSGTKALRAAYRFR
jgi:hypothetical protein